MENLNISGLKKVTDVGIRLLGGCKSLEVVNFSGIFLLTDGMKRDFGLEGIQAFAKECHKLTSINLSSCFQIHQISMTAIARNMPSLKELNLTMCKRIDYSALRPVSDLCPLLAKINFTNCERVDDRCISAIAKGCQFLVHVNLTGCVLITDNSVRALCASCKEIKHLILAGCKKLRDFSIAAIAEANFEPGLVALDLTGCTDISETVSGFLRYGLA